MTFAVVTSLVYWVVRSVTCPRVVPIGMFVVVWAVIDGTVVSNFVD